MGLFGDVNLTSVRFGGASNSIGNQIIESVEISDSTTCSGLHNQSFSNCRKLKKLILPNRLTTITANLLNSSYSLENLVIPESATKIDTFALTICV